ncbi:biotin--[acetyl-CoA-carboxylase] ligase [Flavobacterium aquicola]|uniref:BirA family biotin operon repressor/biotin-[acetyl-CoA-carboxylase] ligase n=1 Tax=Flavobacterium aquicola TaxID=1682742 RepID=A0A3E0ESF3_9FLAO|nr:biotin--[acetyl-CoA-carboxylase] ligase [Flavobacterium aquicola]REH01069.1 BirA family biotin operon repressor/biotin-[acetyl-CoA-carboxylase] ligase [Flavobacterium aquicola]
MKLIKLDAIDSTNEFLKGLSNKQEVQNFTVISAETQLKGKGQMGAKWDSEPGKNLIMSVLVKRFLFDSETVFNLNVVVSLAVIRTLKEYDIPELSIKWPNDIMSANKKIGGILIENSIKGEGAITSIVGLGLNVNQTEFDNLPRASSLALVCNKVFNKEEILFSIVSKINEIIAEYAVKASSLWEEYINELFKIGVPVAFSDENETNFMGIIKGVSAVGKLQIQLEDDTVCEYSLKEVQMLY